MSKLGVQAYAYLGVVSEVLGDTPKEKQEYKIKADIPGVIKGVTAYPRRDTLDEPRPGDPIILLSLDPDFNSYYLYWKLKEDDFTGFRSAGKEIYMTPDEIVARVYEDGDYEKGEYEPGEEIASIKMTKAGEIIMKNRNNTSVTVDQDGNVNVETSGHNMNVNLGGGTITLGNGTLVLNGGHLSGNPALAPFITDPAHLYTGIYQRTTKVDLL